MLPAQLQAQPRQETMHTFRSPFVVLVKCKNMAQWKARVLAAGIPQEAALSVRSPLEAIRLLAVRFIFEAEPGEALCSSLRDRAYFMDEEGCEWLSQ